MIGRTSRIIAPLAMISTLALHGCGPKASESPNHPGNIRSQMISESLGRGGVCFYTIGAHSTGPEMMIDARYGRDAKKYLILDYLREFTSVPDSIEMNGSRGRYRTENVFDNNNVDLILGMCGSRSLIVLNTDK